MSFFSGTYDTQRLSSPVFPVPRRRYLFLAIGISAVCATDVEHVHNLALVARNLQCSARKRANEHNVCSHS
jgi:hypothetical protein